MFDRSLPIELTPFFIGLYKFVKHGLYPLIWAVLLFGATAVLALFPFSPKHSWWVHQLVIFSLLFVTLSSPLVATPLIGSQES